MIILSKNNQFLALKRSYGMSALKTNRSDKFTIYHYSQFTFVEGEMLQVTHDGRCKYTPSFDDLLHTMKTGKSNE